MRLTIQTLFCVLAGSLSAVAADGGSARSAEADTTLQAARAQLEAAEKRLGEAGFDYRAEKIWFDVAGDSILLQGNASVVHKKVRLEAAEMIYRRARDEVEARARRDSNGVVTGVPVLQRGEEMLRGERILYDMETERGTVLNGRIRREKGFYAGQLIHTRSPEEFHVRRGSYTTCDLAAPHFDFYSPRIKVLVEEMAIARPVYLRVKEKRLLWIPFFIFSLREDRQSGLLTPSFGRRPIRYDPDRDSEWEVRNLGYYIAPSDYWDATLTGDVRQRSGWLARARVAYAARYRLSGQVETRLENRQDALSTRWQWWTSLRHNQQLGESAQLRASGTFQSNKDFMRDNSSSLQDRLNRTLRSNLSITKRWRDSGHTLSFNASQTKNLDTGRFDTVLPELRLRTSRKALWDPGARDRAKRANKPWFSQIYYDGSARLRNWERGTAADTTARTAADLTARLATQQRPLPFLHLNTSLTETWKDADVRKSNQRAIRTDQLNATAGVTQTYYGLFHPQVGRVTAFRHVLKPNLSLSYRATRADTGGVLGIGGDGRPWKQTRRITGRLDNTFWVKVQRGEEEAKIRLAQLTFSTSYDMERDIRPLADLVTAVSVAAGRLLDSRLTVRSELYDRQDRLQLLSPRLKQLEVRSSLRWSGRAEDGDERRVGRGRPGDRDPGGADLYGDAPYAPGAGRMGSGFGQGRYDSQRRRDESGYDGGLQRDLRGRRRHLTLSHYYARTRYASTTTSRSWLRTTTGVGWRRRWHLQYSLNYNLRDPGTPLFSADRITSELLSVQRAFHDWTATLNIEPSQFHRDRTFYFKAQFKDIPQIRFERGDGRL